jgi:hypothetical protein
MGAGHDDQLGIARPMRQALAVTCCRQWPPIAYALYPHIGRESYSTRGAL